MSPRTSRSFAAPTELLNSRDVVARVRFSCSATHSGLEQVVRRFQTMRVEAGRITFATGYSTLAKALAAVDQDR